MGASRAGVGRLRPIYGSRASEVGRVVTERDTPAWVGADAFERQLDQVRAAAAGDEVGVFGPGSLTWRVDREAALFLGAGRALLLQLAHPWVAEAIAGHSRALADPIGRFHRTFGTTFALVFGTLDQAFAAARRLHRRHATIEGSLAATAGPFAAGSPYRANDVAALRWVWATLTETALLAHDLALTPLGPAERERYYAESLLLAAMFGLPRAALPPDWAAFTAYNEAMWASDTLTVGPAPRPGAGPLLSGGARPWLRAPRWFMALTAQTLPPRLREAYGLTLGEADRRRVRRVTALIRRTYPLVPRRLRHVGPYQEAQARLRGRGGPDLVTRTLNRLWIGRPRLSD